MIFLILLFEIKEFCSCIGWFLLIGLKSMLFCFKSFLVLFLLRIVWLLVLFEIVNVICDGIFVLIKLEIIFMDGCWVVRIIWIFVVCVFCFKWIIVFLIFLLVIIIKLVNLFIMIMIKGKGICFCLEEVLNFLIFVL